ncbi:MAG TPA: urease accessory protein UreD [Acidimicrobiales bacterium]|nr:urease accessory protein UreD [Acidimicrobiales bacterium]
MDAALDVAVEGHRVVRLAATPPLAAKVLPGAQLLVVGAAASLLEGDRLQVRLRLGPGARLTVRTVAATLAHPCPGGGETRFDVEADLGAGSRLAWLPEPLVACAGCGHAGRARLRLGPGAAALWWEALALGRTGEEPGSLDLRLDADLAGAPLLRDGLMVGGGAGGWDGPAVLDGARHLGTLALLGLDDPEPAAGVMPLAGPGAVARAAGADAAAVEHSLGPVRGRWNALLANPSQRVNVAKGCVQQIVM